MGQLAYFVDANLGKDSNDGSSPALALRTVGEWASRNRKIVSAGASLTILSALAPQDVAEDTVALGPAAQLTISAAPSVVYASTGAGNTTVAAVPAANTAWLLTDTNLPQATWASFLNQGGSSPFRIRKANGATAWPIVEIAGRQARLATPMAQNPALGAFGQSSTMITTADAFNLEQLLQLGALGLKFDISPIALANGQEHVIFQDVAFGAGMITTNDAGLGTQIGFYGCDMGPMLVRGGGDFLNCRWAAPFFEPNDNVNLFGGACCGNAVSDGCLGLNVDFQWALQGGTLNCFGTSGFIGAMQSWDHPAPGAIEVQGGRLVLQQILATRLLFGTSAIANTFGIRVKNGGQVAYINTTGWTLTGASGDTQIGTPATVKSIAALNAAIATGGFVDTNQGSIIVL